MLTERQEEIIQSFAFLYAGFKQVQCTICHEWVETDHISAPAEYQTLGTHLVNSHPEIHKELMRKYQGTRSWSL